MYICTVRKVEGEVEVEESVAFKSRPFPIRLATNSTILYGFRHPLPRNMARPGTDLEECDSAKSGDSTRSSHGLQTHLQLIMV